MVQQQKDFWFRRLHSLLGVLPVGLFLLFHLFTNAKARGGADHYNQAVADIAGIPFLPVVETIFIFLPLLYHGVYGMFIAFTSGYNVGQFSWFRNQMFVWQRITGVITFIFVVYHLWTTRFSGNAPSFDMVATLVNSPFTFWFMIIGVVAAAFHFANGLWSFLIHWGLTVGPRSQRVSAYVMSGIWVVISFLGVSALVAFKYPGA
ncbi:succinate dehydrogenase cytochrome b558 subunit [Effusibacillus dendaii]|uniref:Succinate dehydrogenase cytochrome b558 subunit n=1 Tax=Effusibacillus dendaii TaxID=2743772 RepID=A0A7I8DEP4_9BACL|nr:succinate dehydrogenase cytochrome b558 subunit [Effusibacillus dendaii]BCJ88507.1 succinate dehydrogenase cytochrome b558 subunit [Effusibacillus dendaii]